MKYFLCVLGMVLIIEGLPWFAFPEKFSSMLARLSEVPERYLRIYGISAIIIGLALVYWGRK